MSYYPVSMTPFPVVYYLGSTGVDRRYSAGVLPWIIEEMKLKLDTAQNMKLVWITLGELER